ncbi:MAG: Crp/Fnr family transcriptional regulator, partial [bacterium]
SSVAFRKGERLVQEGEAFHRVFLLCQGRVRLVKSDDQGRQILVPVLSPGDVVGLPPAMTGRTWITSAVGMESGLALSAEPELLGKLVRTTPEVAAWAFTYLSRLLKESWEAGFSSSTKFGRERLAELLLKKLEAHATKGANHPEAYQPVSRTELSEITGFAKETVSRLLRELAQRGIISMHGRRIRISDLRALRKLAGTP